MSEKPQPDPVPVEDPPPHPAEPVKLETPVIDVRELGATDAAAIDAMEELERSLRHPH